MTHIISYLFTYLKYDISIELLSQETPCKDIGVISTRVFLLKILVLSHLLIRLKFSDKTIVVISAQC